MQGSRAVEQLRVRVCGETWAKQCREDGSGFQGFGTLRGLVDYFPQISRRSD